MYLKHLQLSNFRNFSDISLEFPPEGALFEGLNGSGKTNILESIYMLCTGRSQRGANRMAMINSSSDCAYIEGNFIHSAESATVAALGMSRDKKISMKLNETAIHQFSEWFGQRAAISFGSDDLMLVYGTPEHRRKFVDLLLSQIDKAYLETLLRYKRFLHSRNCLLIQKSFDPVQMDIYEESMAEAGAFLVFRRLETLRIIDTFFTEYYTEISDFREIATLEYDPSFLSDTSGENEWKNVFCNVLKNRREKDAAIGYSGVGPHRDELRFLLDKKAAKTYGSQGQCRSIALALKLSSIRCIEQFRNDSMIFLIDDAVAELDMERTARVFPLLQEKGQVFIATPSINIPLKNTLLRCTVSKGTVRTA